MKTPEWQWNEMNQIGTDYTSLDEVQRYDHRMSELRDVAGENRNLLDRLGLEASSTIVEVGTGTGAFARAASAAGHEVYALDISPLMLEYASGRARQEGLKNMHFIHAGFLTYEPDHPQVDAVVSSLALHHLPDLWKAVALQRINQWLRPGGQLYLHDVVFDIDHEAYAAYFDRLTGTGITASSRQPFIRHIRQEFSTIGWIMEGMLDRAGFAVLSIDHAHEYLVSYHARKSREAVPRR